MRAPETSPAGATRERSVKCPLCGRVNWNHSAVCWLCKDRARKVARDEAEAIEGFNNADYLVGTAGDNLAG